LELEIEKHWTYLLRFGFCFGFYFLAMQKKNVTDSGKKKEMSNKMKNAKLMWMVLLMGLWYKLNEHFLMSYDISLAKEIYRRA
jgi:hypothetical protein